MFDENTFFFATTFNDHPMVDIDSDVSPEHDQDVKTHSEPSLYGVILIHDENTPDYFVIGMLQQQFHMSYKDASLAMDELSKEGQSTCGIYTREVAETKMMHVINLARENDFPLKCIIRRNK